MAAKAKKTTKSTEKPTTTSVETLTKQAAELREEALTLKRNIYSGDVQNIRAYKYKRRELARILTKINKIKKEK